MPTKAPDRKTLASLIYDTGGRRFFISVATLTAATVLCWFGKINGEWYAAVMIGVVAAFITGVTVQRVKAGAE